MSRVQPTARRHLGQGWAFPVRVGQDGAIEYSAGEKNVQESIWILLGTALGERVMRPSVGCGVFDLVFAPNNVATRAEMQARVRQALIRHEQRINVLAVQVDSEPERPEVLLIRVDYQIRSNNARGNVVYPFFLREGEGL